MTVTMAVVSSSPSSSSSRARSDNPTLYGTRTSSPSFASGYVSSTARFSSRNSSTAPAAPFVSHSCSPTRMSMYRRSAFPSSRSVLFSAGRPVSPRQRSISVAKQSNGGGGGGGGKGHCDGNGSVSCKKKRCMCSPTTHPGSFRCSLHKNSQGGGRDQTPPSYHSIHSSKLNLMRSAMANSLVRIGGVEGDLVKRALSALIRPSSHQQRRRSGFEPRPSRLSVMSTAEDS